MSASAAVATEPSQRANPCHFTAAILGAVFAAAVWAQAPGPSPEPSPSHVKLGGRVWGNEPYAVSARWEAGKGAGLVFAFRGEDDYWVAWVENGTATFFRRQKGKWERIGGVRADGAAEWTLLAAPQGATLLRDGRYLAGFRQPMDVSGRAGAARSDGAPDLAGLSVRPLAPPAFEDDFQRGAEGLAEWSAVSGIWRPDSVQDAWLRVDGHPPKAARLFGAGSPGLLVTGLPLWAESATQVAVKFEQPGEAGIVFGYRSPQDYSYLVVKAGDEGFARLGCVVAGQDRVISGAAMPVPLGAWLGLRVENNLLSISAFVGHTPLMRPDVFAPFPAVGKAGLIVSGPGAVFDDFRVSPLSPAAGGEPLLRRAELFHTSFAAEQTADKGKGRMLRLVGGALKPGPGLSAAVARGAGESMLRLSGKGVMWLHQASPGDADFRVRLRPAPPATTRLIIAASEAGGYELVISKDKVGLWRQGKELSFKPAAGLIWPAEARLWRQGRTVRGCAGAVELKAEDAEPLEGGRVGVAVEGETELLEMTLANNLASASRFDDVETDWRPSAGQWVEHGGMTCMAWSYWISARAEPVALLWNAFAWPADFTASVWAGEATLGEETRTHKHFPYHSVQFIVAGNGRDLDKGYRFSIAEGPGKDLTRLYRNGVVMAETRAFRIVMGGHCNNPRGFQITVQRQGARLTLLMDGRTLIDFTDPQPLGPGQIGIGCLGCRADFKDFFATVDKPWLWPELPEAWTAAKFKE